MARLYANENFPLEVVEELRKRGHDVLTVREAGRDNQRINDEEVLAFAVSQQRAIITRNRRDFIRLHRQYSMHHGIIVCTEDDDSEGQAGRVDAAIRAIESLESRLVRVHRPNS